MASLVVLILVYLVGAIVTWAGVAQGFFESAQSHGREIFAVVAGLHIIEEQAYDFSAFFNLRIGGREGFPVGQFKGKAFDGLGLFALLAGLSLWGGQRGLLLASGIAAADFAQHSLLGFGSRRLCSCGRARWIWGFTPGMRTAALYPVAIWIASPGAGSAADWLTIILGELVIVGNIGLARLRMRLAPWRTSTGAALICAVVIGGPLAFGTTAQGQEAINTVAVSVGASGPLVPAPLTPAEAAASELVPRWVFQDSTGFKGGEPGNTPFPHGGAVSPDGRWLLVATATGAEIYEIVPGRSPVRRKQLGKALFPRWPSGDKDFFCKSAAWLQVGGQLVGALSIEEGGIALLTWDGVVARVIWQDASEWVNAVAAYDGELYVAAQSHSYRFDVSAVWLAACAAIGPVWCTGPPRLEIAAPASHHAVEGGIVALSRGAGRGEISLWTTGAYPKRRAQISTTLTYGVAIWEDSGKLYLGAAGTTLRVWDVSACRTAACAPIFTSSTPTIDESFPPSKLPMQNVTAGTVDGRPVVYLGSSAIGTLCVDRREYLYELVGGVPREMATAPGQWCWYYGPCAAATSRCALHGNGGTTAPMGAVIDRGVLYRFGLGFADAADLRLAFAAPPGRIFSDGFEGGDVCAWGGCGPPPPPPLPPPPPPDALEIVYFKAVCGFGFCSFDVGKAVPFNVLVTGNPTSYQYDWSSTDGVFRSASQTSAVPVSSHIYTKAGCYRPVMRVVKGAQSATLADQNTAALAVGGCES
jgi:hypothetical protein